MAYRLLCVRFTCLVHAPHSLLTIRALRRRRNTRYGWVVGPYPTGTCTPQDTPSFAWHNSEENEELRKRNQKRREGEPLIRERDMEKEERRRRNQKRLERSVMPEGVPGRHVPRKEPAPPADFEKAARRVCGT